MKNKSRTATHDPFRSNSESYLENLDYSDFSNQGLAAACKEFLSYARKIEHVSYHYLLSAKCALLRYDDYLRDNDISDFSDYSDFVIKDYREYLSHQHLRHSENHLSPNYIHFLVFIPGKMLSSVS